MRFEKDFREIKNQEKVKEFVLIIIKPEGLQYEAEIRNILLKFGNIKEIRNVVTTKEQIAEHYSESQFNKNGKINHYYPGIIKYFSEKEVTVFVLENNNSFSKNFIKNLRRNVIGSSDPVDNRSGQIRYIAIEKNIDYRKDVFIEETGDISSIKDNLIHCSDSLEAALREIKIWYKDDKQIIKDYEEKYKEIEGK